MVRCVTITILSIEADEAQMRGLAFHDIVYCVQYAINERVRLQSNGPEQVV